MCEFAPQLSTFKWKTKCFSATSNQPTALHLLIRELFFSNPHLLRKVKPRAPAHLVGVEMRMKAHTRRFVRASDEGLAMEWRHQRRSAYSGCKRVGAKKENAPHPPPPQHQSFSLQRCLVIFIYWDDFARNPVAWLYPPHSLICCLVLSWLSLEKEGSRGGREEGGGSQRDPQRKKHGS